MSAARTVPQILADLDSRGLLEHAKRHAAKHHVPIGDMCTARDSVSVHARRTFQAWLVGDEVRFNMGTVARIFGCHDSSISYSLTQLKKKEQATK